MNETVELLKHFLNKAMCRHSNRKTERIYRELSHRLTDLELNSIKVAWSHFNLGEGPEELIDIVKGMIASKESE